MFDRQQLMAPLNPAQQGLGGSQTAPLSPPQPPRDSRSASKPSSPASITLSPPLRGLSRPGGAAQVEEVWWIDPPSRQSTAGSTVASEADYLPPPALGTPSLPRRLAKLQEQRGWKHFFRHVMVVPLALVAGMALGAGVAAGVLLSLAHGPPPMPPTSPVLPPYALASPPSEVPAAYTMSPALDNSCLLPRLTLPAGPQTFDACGFVVRSTDEVWNLRGDVDSAIEKYFHENYLDAGSWGRRIVGKKALRDAILAQMRAFPDIRIHITDCVCQGNDNDGYKCAMPDVLSGTNIGPSAYGPPTGRYARWTGMVQSLVKRNEAGQWQYYAEWGVHDEWSLIQQLGLDFSRVPHPPANYEPLHDCKPLLQFDPAPRLDATDVEEQQAAARAAVVAAAARP